MKNKVRLGRLKQKKIYLSGNRLDRENGITQMDLGKGLEHLQQSHGLSGVFFLHQNDQGISEARSSRGGLLPASHIQQ